MDSSTDSTPSLPTLEHLIGNVDAEFDFLSDDMKNRFVAGAIRKNVASGCHMFLCSSPRAKKLKKLVETTQAYLPECEQESFINDAVASYITQKKNELPDCKQKSYAEAPTAITSPTLAHVETFQAYNPETYNTESEQESLLNVAVPPHVTTTIDDVQCGKRINYVASHFRSTPPTVAKVKNTRIASSFVESQHDSVAEALDTIGPARVLIKTDTSTETSTSMHSHVPAGWHLRVYRCYNRLCPSNFSVWSQTKDLASSPAYLRITFADQHQQHNPIDWQQWYNYCSNNSMNESGFDDYIYPKRPGLPKFILLAVKQIIQVYPNAQPSAVSRLISDSFNGHPLFINPGRTSELIISQVKSLVKRTKNDSKGINFSTVTRIRYTGDTWVYIQRHRLNYDRLLEINWDARPRRGPEWIRAMATRLKSAGVMTGLGLYENLPERDLIVLDSDEVLENDRWRQLKDASEKSHTTGPDPRRRTVVFTSLALLGNAIWCNEINWNVAASVDGTHAMSRTSYKLITFGIFGFSVEKRTRSFHPLLYMFGEGEREIVALHGFLNLKVALRRLFGIQDIFFKKGVVTDATYVFANSLKHAFPSSPIMTCYPHVIRKFKIDHRVGNGGYKAYLRTQPTSWLTIEAEAAVKKCSLCKTKEQKDMMWRLTKHKWELDGESVLANVFAKTYINDENFANWYYTASGLHGCVPCNNPMERYNLSMKGTSSFDGYVAIGKDMKKCLTEEFVTLVYRSSTDLSFPTTGLPVLDIRKSLTCSQFMEFQLIFDPAVDLQDYRGGWLLNDVEYLQTKISEDDIQKMERALAGEIEDNAVLVETTDKETPKDIRDILLQRTKRFHFVKKSTWQSNNETVEYFECDCRDYFFKRWCFQSAYMQHRDQLGLLGQMISTKAKRVRKGDKKQLIAEALKSASRKKSMRKEM